MIKLIFKMKDGTQEEKIIPDNIQGKLIKNNKVSSLSISRNLTETEEAHPTYIERLNSFVNTNASKISKIVYAAYGFETEIDFVEDVSTVNYKVGTLSYALATTSKPPISEILDINVFIINNEEQAEV